MTTVRREGETSRLRTAGLIGGMSWESTQHYYRLLNEGVRDHLGPSASAPILLHSFNFAEIESLQNAGDWRALDALMVDSASRLADAGADFLAICSNSMHKCAPAITDRVALPLVHIADPVARMAHAAGWTRLGLLGTRFTMEGNFLKERLARNHGLQIVVPDESERLTVHDIIYHELVAGIVDPGSRTRYVDIIDRLAGTHRAQGVILGCTEIMLLLGQQDTPVPLIDTTTAHVAGILDRMFDEPARREA